MISSTLTLVVDRRAIEVEQFRFPGGEMQVRILDGGLASAEQARITSYIRSSDDFLATLLLTNAVKMQYASARVDLVCPYMPYARQDRVAYPGEARSIQVAAEILNTQGYSSVEVWDVHSDIASRFVERLRNVPAADFLRGHVGRSTVIVAPDAGAIARATRVANDAGAQLIHAEKIRDTNTGAISHTVVHSEHLGDRDCLIVDDICDGGRTFVELAQVLRPLTTGSIGLYVTHGIFSKGFDVLRDAGIDRIFTANSFVAAAELPDWVQILKRPTAPLSRQSAASVQEISL